ncbi:MAG: tetratricopeptide repeat protein [Elusimicrobiales bacterium]|jgi:tetratricopeptide (TPR) repeat protein
MKLILLAALFGAANLCPALLPLALAQPAGGQDDRAAAENRELTLSYDKAFESYLAGDYQKAIEYWNQILRLDPTQVTAKNMIEEARQKLSGSAAGQKGRFYALVARGQYGEALLKITEMAAVDPANALYSKLAGRLKKVSAIAERKPSNSRPWNIAAQGIFHFVNEEENLPFAYDAFRYAAELSPKDARLARLTSMLEEESPQLKLNDTKPAQTGVLDHKKELALHYIYDSKYYLAVRELEDALKLEPEDTTSLKRLGSTYLQLKDYARAREAWEKALKLAPEDEQLKEYMKALDKIPQAAASKKPKKRRTRKTR